MTTTPDCRKCGACCVEQVILLRQSDHVPLAMRDGMFMRKQGGRCVALAGRVGVDCRCSIYTQRPEICRVMKPGVHQCHMIRASLYLEPTTPELVPELDGKVWDQMPEVRR